MKYELSRTPKSDVIFYSVYNLSVEKADATDALCDIRKQFFETGKKLKGRLSVKNSDDVFKFSYTIENGQPLKWKKVCGEIQLERVFAGVGGYRIESFDFARRLIKKTYYTLEHFWVKTEFFSYQNKLTPSYTVSPMSDDTMAVLLKSSSNREEKLLPFTALVDKNMTQRLNAAAGEPEIFCKTSDGGFYFCTEEELECRKQILNKLLEEENEQTHADEEQINSAFVIKKQNEQSNTVDLANSEPFIATSQEPKADNTEETEKTELLSAKEAASFPVFTSPKDKSEGSTTADTELSENEPPVYADEPIEAQIFEEASAESNAAEPTDEATESETEKPYIYEKIIPSELRETMCGFASRCPYEDIEKKEIISAEQSYYYFGELNDGKRHGRGRTAMQNGGTAYEGMYSEDKRSGFGAYYFKSGKMCYTGMWKDNKREGLGVAYSTDGSAYIGKWHNDKPIENGASFDANGSLKYLGAWKDGKRNGGGITYTADGNILVGIYSNGDFTGKGTLLDKNGTLIYNGQLRNGERSGEGIEYYEDGTIRYKGEWRGGRYNGRGVLYLTDGGYIDGEFRYGAAEGHGTKYDKNGKKIYDGIFSNNLYNGTGRLYNSDGSYCEGRFADGETSGMMSVYTEDGELLYTGEWKDSRRNGKGVEYLCGEKVYDGDFCDGRYSGEGRLYKDGELIYAGSFENGIRTGCGCEYDGGNISYRGIFKNDMYNGCGMLYENGEIAFVGMFSNGKKQGRINEIRGGRIVKECIYNYDELVYMREYSFSDGSLVYDGNVQNGKRGGMGCSFISYGEKQFEGIFRNGEPLRSMSVMLKSIEPLPSCEELEGSEYDYFKDGTGYVVEYPVGKGIYTGRLKNKKPNGKGTILYSDHRFTGEFSDGEPSGKGVIYMLDGEEIHGIFEKHACAGTDEIKLCDVSYYCKMSK